MPGREIPCAYREVPLRKCHPFSMTMVNYQRVYSGSAPCPSHLISRVNMGPNIQPMTNRADEPCSQGHAGTGLVLLTSQGSKHGIWLEVHSSGIIPVAILGTCWVHLIQPKIWRCLRWLWNHPKILFGKRLFEATNLWYLMVHISEMPNSPWLPHHLLIPVTIPQINSLTLNSLPMFSQT